MSPIVGVSNIGQLSTAKSSIYFKYFYFLKYNWHTFLLSKRRSTQDIWNLEGSKIQDPKIHHLLYQWCVETTQQLREEHHAMMMPHTKFSIMRQQHFGTVEIKLIISNISPKYITTILYRIPTYILFWLRTP